MELSREETLINHVITAVWEDENFKQELLNSPEEAIKQLTGEDVKLGKGKKLVVRDQTDPDTIYINVPPEPNLDDVELNEDQLEAVAGGCYMPFIPTLLPIFSPILPEPVKPDGNQKL